VWEDDLREAGSCSNPRMHLNWTQHNKAQWAKNKMRRTIGSKRSLHQNDDCSRLQHDMDLRFHAYHCRLQELSRKYCKPESKFIRGRGGRHKLLLFWNLNVTGVNATLFPSCPSFLATKLNTHFHCLNKMNKKLGMRVPDCLIGAHEPK
jgi:hypothetical protein